MMNINAEVMKAGTLMTRYRIPREQQIEVVRILMAAGVEHCPAGEAMFFLIAPDRHGDCPLKVRCRLCGETWEGLFA